VLQTTHHLLAFTSFPAQLCMLYQVETSSEDRVLVQNWEEGILWNTQLDTTQTGSQ